MNPLCSTLPNLELFKTQSLRFRCFLANSKMSSSRHAISDTRRDKSRHDRKRHSKHDKTRDRVRDKLERHKHRRIKRKSQKTTLNFEKFVEYVETRNHYYVVSVIVDSASGCVKFIECRTPIRQKTFFVYISPKYVMKAPDEKLVRMKITYLKDEAPSKRNREFIESVRGRTVKCDMLIIASDMVYFVTQGTDSIDTRCFTVGDAEDEIEEPVKVNKIQKITDHIKKIASSLGVERVGSSKVPKIEDFEDISSEEDIVVQDADNEPYDPVKSTINTDVGGIIVGKDDKGKIVETLVTEKPLELPSDLPKKLKRSEVEEDESEDLLSEDIDIEEDFEDGVPTPKSSPVPSVPSEIPTSECALVPVSTQPPASTPTSPTVTQPVTTSPATTQPVITTQPVTTSPATTQPVAPTSSKSDNFDESSEELSSSEDESDIDEDNEIPDIEDEGIVLGMAYIVIDVTFFFSKIDSYETELAEYYTEIEENEQSMRKTKVERIIQLADGVRDKVTRWFATQSTKEASVKTGITALSVAILQISSIKQRIESNPAKYRSDVIQEITSLDELYTSSREMVREQTVKLLKIRDLIENVLYESTEILEKSTCTFHDYLSSDDES